MSPLKLIRIAAVAVAVIAAFVAIPYVALIMIVLGLALGVMGVEAERRTAYLVMAVALSMVTGAMGPVPAVGEYLTAILENTSTIINAGAVAVISMGIYEKVME